MDRHVLVTFNGPWTSADRLLASIIPSSFIPAGWRAARISFWALSSEGPRPSCSAVTAMSAQDLHVPVGHQFTETSSQVVPCYLAMHWLSLY